jgi:hypothetical protein
MARVLTVGDLHLPAVRKGYLTFCQDLYYQWDCNDIVFIGDVVDWTAISFHASEPMCPGPLDEYKLAKECVAEWAKAFPKAKVCIGNHDERPARLAKTVNIPEFMLIPYAELWDTPEWDWDYKFMIDDVSYRHGSGLRGGIHPAWTMMNKVHTSSVIGHLHARFAIEYSMPETKRLFGMSVGCGIDEAAFNFAYGRDVLERPAVGAGVIIDGVPHLEPMLMGSGEIYHDSNF